MMPTLTQEAAATEHGWQERRNWCCPMDRRLRTAGFQIVSRPKTGEAIWEKNGARFPESQAVVIAQAIERNQGSRSCA